MTPATSSANSSATVEPDAAALRQFLQAQQFNHTGDALQSGPRVLDSSDPPAAPAIPAPRDPCSPADAAIHGLYLHIPFCFHKCCYCDFYSIADQDPDRHDDFTQRLVDQLTRLARHARDSPAGALRPATCFVGGGTPTLLAPDLWQTLLTAMARLGLTDALTEFTVEANPETVRPELVDVLTRAGVDRFSLGAQSFQPRLLRTLERWHDPDNVARSVDRLRDAGVRRINLDLIFAIPGQTWAELDDDLDRLLALGPDHVSVYGLTFEPGTALDMQRQRGRVTPEPDDRQAAMYRHVQGRLAEAGFEQYEISAWAASPEQRSRHNLGYWRHDDWLGVGPSAGSHVAGWKWRETPHLGQWLDPARADPITGLAPRIDVEPPDPQRDVGETLMMRLRLRDGVAAAWLDAHLAAADPRRATIASLTGAGLLETTAIAGAPHLRLTQRGLLLADAVIAELL